MSLCPGLYLTAGGLSAKLIRLISYDASWIWRGAIYDPMKHTWVISAWRTDGSSFIDKAFDISKEQAA